MAGTTKNNLQTLAQQIVDALPDPSPEQCRRVAALLQAAQAKDVLLSRQDVAERLGVSTRWLIRNAGDGPSYYKLPGGTIRYRESDLNQWLRQRRKA